MAKTTARISATPKSTPPIIMPVRLTPIDLGISDILVCVRDHDDGDDGGDIVGAFCFLSFLSSFFPLRLQRAGRRHLLAYPTVRVKGVCLRARNGRYVCMYMCNKRKDSEEGQMTVCRTAPRPAAAAAATAAATAGIAIILHQQRYIYRRMQRLFVSVHVLI